MGEHGFFAIGIEHTKTEQNVGSLWRSAHSFGAAFLFTIGRRYKRQCSDTSKAWRQVPLLHFATLDDLLEHLPLECRLVGVEQCDRSVDVASYRHPERAVYLLGAEDHGLTARALERCHDVISIDTPRCLNVAVAGSIVMSERHYRGRRAS